ncbi:LacI family DNA-binding transcriptional regulator [Corynebacterium breve]|uniref:LacI family DNA-binding transcriptional regulator n=1 Tax=Corynebacterium breve TaxID=3049799 RepID=A0ABY8VDS4_9CORY|nr:LacI family DNA-binding transcriptional regulator [Corynebacterium breve]WIM67826.1 LacI family DNA-binding transcriptional regulator [Corynebacterium breve]
MSKKKPTIIDIAHATGLSKSLVSRALAGKAGVGEESRTRILETADRLGYKRNTWATSLVKGSSHMIGVIATDIASTYRLEVITGVEDAAAEAGYTALLAHGRRDPEVLAERLAQMHSLGVDGVVVVSSRMPSGPLSAVARSTPIVIVGRPAEAPVGVDLIHNDDETGGALATQHLIDIGHTRIGFVASSQRAAIRAREQAWRDTLAAAGLSDDFLLRRQNEEDLAQRTMNELVLSDDPPTALVASTDGLAAAIVGAAQDRGLVVPDDLAVVGYNNSSLSTQLRPQLTTVDQPRHEMGKLAVEMILERLAGRTTDRVTVAEPRLVVRDSSSTSVPATPTTVHRDANNAPATPSG